MRTQTQRLQDLRDSIIKFSKGTKDQSKIGNDYCRGLYTGWTDCYINVAKWIDEIIDLDKQTN